MEKTIQKTFMTISKEVAFFLAAIIGAVVLPQICHGVGVMFGVDGQLGQMLLPMYFPVMLIGFLRGKVSGVLAGLATPLISFALTTMPSAAMLPFVTVELVATGLVAGMLSDVKLPAVCRVLAVQVIAKAVRLVVFAASFYVTNGTVTASALFAGMWLSIPGVLLQLAVVGAILAKRGQRDAG